MDISYEANEGEQAPAYLRAQIQADQERFVQILELNSEPCLVTDSAGAIGLANSSALALLKVSMGETIGTQLEQFVTPLGYPNLSALLDSVPFSFTRAYESTIKPKTGEEFQGLSKVTALAAPNDTQPSFLWQLQDRSLRKSVQSSGHAAHKKTIRLFEIHYASLNRAWVGAGS
jgi:nitrogen-specific signal transduction histidine kinase